MYKIREVTLTIERVFSPKQAPIEGSVFQRFRSRPVPLPTQPCEGRFESKKCRGSKNSDVCKNGKEGNREHCTIHASKSPKGSGK